MDALLDAFGIDWKLLLVQVVNFGILIVALWFLLYKPVMTMLENRKNLIKKGVEDAEAAAVALAGADAEATKRVNAADTEAAGLVASARETANAERVRLLKEAEERAAKVASDADARAKETAAKALKDSEKEIARLAILAAEKAMQKS